jgi:hypothetical protein
LPAINGGGRIKMSMFIKEYRTKTDKEEIQKWFADIVNELCPNDKICINIERQTDYDEIIDVLINEGAVVF